MKLMTELVYRHDHTYQLHHGDVNEQTINRYAIALAESIALLVRNDQRLSQGYSFPTPDGFGPLCNKLWPIMRVPRRRTEDRGERG